MRELPVLFRTKMVRAILADRKWKTRRVIKLPPAPNHLGSWEPTTIGGEGIIGADGTRFIREQVAIWHTRTGKTIISPWEKGDHLWVRETHSIKSIGGARTDFVYYKATPDCGRWLNRSNEWIEEKPLNKFHTLPNKWSSPLFMPKWAARLWLDVLDVKVERLQDGMTGLEAVAEGFGQGLHEADLIHFGGYKKAKEEFREYWDTIYKKKPEYQWQANPYVWVYEFKKIDHRRIK